MTYHVEFAKTALKEIKKLDKYTASLIIGWIEKNIEGCENPRVHGKGLVGNRSGQWRYRVGDYRLIVLIKDEVLTILVVGVGHRKEVYKN